MLDLLAAGGVPEAGSTRSGGACVLCSPHNDRPQELQESLTRVRDVRAKGPDVQSESEAD